MPQALIAVALTKASRHIRLLGCVLGGATVVLSVLHRDAGSLWKGLETALPFAAFLPTVVMLRGAVEEEVLRAHHLPLMVVPDAQTGRDAVANGVAAALAGLFAIAPYPIQQ